MWGPLLMQAAELANIDTSSGVRATARFASSIVLARASFEAFVSEFIERRLLAKRIKGIHDLRERILAVHAALGVDAPDESSTPWVELGCVVQLRNAVVHYEAAPRSPADSPARLYGRFQSLGVVAARRKDQSWERALLTSTVASWSCQVVGQTVIRLESIATRRHRSLIHVREQVVRAIQILEK